MIKHAVSLSLTLFGLWLLLSGHYNPLMIGFGVVSTLLVVFLALRMEVMDHEAYPFHMTLRLARFWLFLAWEIVVANLEVAKRVFGPRSKVSPRVIDIRPPQRTDLGLVIYANSITLTPGTVSMEVTPERIRVHALTPEGADDLIAERMARRVPEDNLTEPRERN